MIEDLRDNIRDCRQALQRLDQQLTSAEEVRPLPAAKLLVLLDTFTGKLGRLGGQLVSPDAPQDDDDQPGLFDQQSPKGDGDQGGDKKKRRDK